jgi:hypothetical protein
MLSGLFHVCSLGQEFTAGWAWIAF